MNNITNNYKKGEFILNLLRESGIFALTADTKQSFYNIEFITGQPNKTKPNILVESNKVTPLNTNITDNHNQIFSNPNSSQSTHHDNTVRDRVNINTMTKNNLDKNPLITPKTSKVDLLAGLSMGLPIKGLPEDIKEKLNNANTLNEVESIVKMYKQCSIAQTATNAVFGCGNPQVNILLIGEAPGADEDEQGEPFVGKSGQLLMKALASINIIRSNIFITNTIFWRPPGNRDPSAEEVALCKPFVQKIISILKPKVIFIVGKVAAYNVLGCEGSMANLRGKWLTYSLGETNNLVNDILVRVLYHPAYLLRNPMQKKVFWFDLIEIYNKLVQLQLV